MLSGSFMLLAGTTDSGIHFEQGLALCLPYSPYAAFRPLPIEAALVSGTGLTGMCLSDQRPCLSPGYGFADLTIMTPEFLRDPLPGIRAFGFFGLDWILEPAGIVRNLRNR